MATFQSFCIAFVICVIIVSNSNNHITVYADMSENMFLSVGNGLSKIEGDTLQLVLDQSIGPEAKSKRNFLFGSFEALIKLVPKASAGLVMSYYLSSTGVFHDDIAYEFIANATSYTIYTHIFAHGDGNKEQRFQPWFDPAADFHNYTIHWNPNTIVWYIDSIPIRVFRNYENEAKQRTHFPNKQGMRLYATLMDDGTTGGSSVDINWANAPFIANVRQIRPRGCQWRGEESNSQCATPSPANWWTSPAYAKLSAAQLVKLKEVREKYMTYDYCKDPKRKLLNGLLPPECYRPQY